MGVCIGAIVLVLYVPIMFFLARFPNVFPVYGDGPYYIILADNLLNQGIFSGSLEAPFVPATFIMPIYPVLIFLFKVLAGSYTFFPIIQVIFVGVTAYLIFKIGDKFFSATSGIIASLLYVIDPTTILHSMLIMTDITYTLFIAVSVYFIFATDAGDRRSVFLGGLMLGLAMLTRVISMFLPLVIIPMYFFVRKGEMPLKKLIVNILIILVAYCAVVVPWMFRNEKVSGVFGIAGEKSLNLFQYYVPEFLSYKRGISADEGRNILMNDLIRETGPLLPGDIASLKYAPIEERIALGYIKSDIFGYAKFHLIKTVPFFLSSGLKNMFTYYNNAVGYEAYPTNNGNLTSLLSQGRVNDFLSELRVQPFVTLEQIYWAIVSILSVISLVVARGENRKFVFVCVALVLYYALLTGPMAYSRFRLPAEPFLYLLATSGLVIFAKIIRRKFKVYIPQ